MHILNTLQQSDSIQTKVIKRLYSNQRNKFSRLTIIILLSSNAHSHNIGDNLRLHNSKNSTNCTQFIEINVLFTQRFNRNVLIQTWNKCINTTHWNNLIVFNPKCSSDCTQINGINVLSITVLFHDVFVTSDSIHLQVLNRLYSNR